MKLKAPICKKQEKIGRVAVGKTKKVKLTTIYGKRVGNDMEFYTDKKLCRFKARIRDKYYLKDRTITLNCCKYNLKVVKK